MHGVAPGDLGDAADGGCRDSRVDTHGDRCGDRLRCIAEVRAPGKQQVKGDADAVRSAQRRTRPFGGELNLLEPPLGLRTARQFRQFLPLECGDQMPVVTGADNTPTARIRGRVTTPSSTGCDPHDVRIVGGGRGDEGVIAVRDDDGVRMSRGPLAQATLHRSDLPHTIKLVAREVEVDEDGRIHVGRNGGDVHLVDFEGGTRRTLALHESREDARRHVVAVDVRGDTTSAFERRTHHARCRRLAVRAGDDHG